MVETVTDIVSRLGEGPIWYREKLYWVDIVGKRVHVYEPASRSARTIEVGYMVGTVVPRLAGGLVVALENGFAFLDEDSGAVTPIIDPEADQPGNRFNDGKCDPAGRFWAGTMSLHGKARAGALYMLDREGMAHERLEGITTSNGICWSLDYRTMYYIDTPTQEVVAFDFDMAAGLITNARSIIKIDAAEGHPDGMTIDERGHLWIALWDGGAVVCHDPTSGRRLAKVEVPASRATACAFGGPHLDELYITSASVGLTDEQRQQQPLAGRLFRTNVGVGGVPAFAFAG